MESGDDAAPGDEESALGGQDGATPPSSQERLRHLDAAGL